MATDQHVAKIMIKFEEKDQRHPHCPHGPMLHFYYSNQKLDEATNGYFACSAYRDRKQCNFYIPISELNQTHLDKKFELPIKSYRQQRNKVKSHSSSEICFCHDCHQALNPGEEKLHKNHNLQSSISKDQLEDPTKFLRPLDNDVTHAQYFFDDKALQFFHSCFQNLNINKVLCIGAPRLHFYLRKLRKSKKTNIESFLLDLDQRFYYFLEDDEYAWYNMCNNYFFDNLQKEAFEKFMRLTDCSNLLLFTDPPFACRTEVISNNLQQLTNACNKLNNRLHQPVPIFWIFPYFSENYIEMSKSEMEMCDFKINYTNHSSYTDVGSNKRFYGSPVRLFTNVPLELIKLPLEEYKFCSVCKRFTAKENLHCGKCKICPSKNGSTYKHCNICDKCVKPSYKHCLNCRRCSQMENHDCEKYQQQQYCWICLKKGHVEHSCDVIKNIRKDRSRKNSNKNHPYCLLCQKVGHNERKCKKRQILLKKYAN